jgi:hypothetical protein
MKPGPSLLLVALAMASNGFADPKPQPVSAVNAWQQVQQTDAARALTYIRFTLNGKFRTAPGGAASGRPALLVDCIPDKESHLGRKFLSAKLQVGTALKIVYVEPDEIHGVSYYPQVAVRFSTDGGEEQHEKWSAGTDKSSVSISKDLLKKILRARSVAISANDQHGSDLAMQFDMPDPKLVEESCNVD